MLKIENIGLFLYVFLNKFGYICKKHYNYEQKG